MLLLLLAAFLVLPQTARGQIIEFEPPAQIEVDTTRVIVTFADTVEVQEAREVVESVGASVESINYGPVLAWGLFFAMPDPERVLALRRDERPDEVAVLPPSAAIGTWITLDDGQRVMADFNTHALRASFPPMTGSDKVLAVIHTYLPDLPVRVERSPNEVVVALPEVGGEGVVEELEANPLVEYVTYFNLYDPFGDE